jgi:hypothetical protein
MLTCEQVRFYALFNGYCGLKTPKVIISKVNHPSIYGLLCDDSGVYAQEQWVSELKSGYSSKLESLGEEDVPWILKHFRSNLETCSRI